MNDTVLHQNQDSNAITEVLGLNARVENYTKSERKNYKPSTVFMEKCTLYNGEFFTFLTKNLHYKGE